MRQVGTRSDRRVRRARRWAGEVGRVTQALGRHFVRAEPRGRVGAYLQGLLKPYPNRCG